MTTPNSLDVCPAFAMDSTPGFQILNMIIGAIIPRFSETIAISVLEILNPMFNDSQSHSQPGRHINENRMY